MKLLRFNEMSEWQKDIRLIMDIINIAKDDNSLTVEVESDVVVNIPVLKIRIRRSDQATNTFEFCEICQNMLERLRATNHNIKASIQYKKEGNYYPTWYSDNWIDNPIEYGYNTNIEIGTISLHVSDHKKSFIKRAWDHFPGRKK